jgi:5-formyltetrahydrofolate cyclo-ligase
LTGLGECGKTQAVTKSELRKEYLEKQKAFSAEERTARSRRIAEQFFKNVDLGGALTIHCFIPIEKFNEIDTMPIFERLWREFPRIQTVVPRVDPESGEMRSLKFASETELVKNAWEIYEPAHHESVEPGEIDMVLVPLLCIDSQGHRVGYGKGFYDRFLSKCSGGCFKIGLSYFAPVDAIEDVHPGDVSLDLCVTLEGVSVF